MALLLVLGLSWPSLLAGHTKMSHKWNKAWKRDQIKFNVCCHATLWSKEREGEKWWVEKLRVVSSCEQLLLLRKFVLSIV